MLSAQGLSKLEFAFCWFVSAADERLQRHKHRLRDFRPGYPDPPTAFVWLECLSRSTLHASKCTFTVAGINLAVGEIGLMTTISLSFQTVLPDQPLIA